jgi:hypothetical protein
MMNVFIMETNGAMDKSGFMESQLLNTYSIKMFKQ